MVMPVQLRTAPHPKRSESRPVIELMPAISIHDLRHVIPRSYDRHNELDGGFKYPSIRTLRLSFHHMDIVDYCGRKQSFAIKWVRTYFGPHRPVFLCNCGRGAIRLFAKYGTYACRHCQRAIYASQREDSTGRKHLTACKLRLQLGGLPNINEPFPAKRKWAHRKRYQQLRNQAKALEAKANARRFRKPVATKLFAYHVP